MKVLALLFFVCIAVQTEVDAQAASPWSMDVHVMSSVAIGRPAPGDGLGWGGQAFFLQLHTRYYSGVDLRTPGGKPYSSWGGWINLLLAATSRLLLKVFGSCAWTPLAAGCGWVSPSLHGLGG